MIATILLLIFIAALPFILLAALAVAFALVLAFMEAHGW